MAANEKKPLYKPMKSTKSGKKMMVYVMKDGKKRRKVLWLA